MSAAQEALSLLLMCHPERRYSRHHRECHSRRTCGCICPCCCVFSTPSTNPSFRPKRPAVSSWAAQWRNLLLHHTCSQSAIRICFCFACCLFLHTIKKNVTSIKATMFFALSCAVQKYTASHTPILSRQVRFFPCHCIHRRERRPLHQHPKIPIVTVLSPAKLVKTPVSWSSQT